MSIYCPKCGDRMKGMIETFYYRDEKVLCSGFWCGECEVIKILDDEKISVSLTEKGREYLLKNWDKSQEIKKKYKM